MWPENPQGEHRDGRGWSPVALDEALRLLFLGASSGLGPWELNVR